MISPVGYCVLIRPDTPKEVSKSSVIAIPDSVSDQWRISVDTGTVVGIGDLAWKGLQGGDGTPWAKKNDRVIYAKFGGKVMQDEETKEKFILIADKDVLAII